MNVEGLDVRWSQLVEEVVVGMRDWRTAHPRATFREIEAALDERLHRVRARMLEDAALASGAAEWAGQSEEGPGCPDCEQVLEKRGRHERGIRVQGGQEVQLCRHYGVCPACGRGIFPLDEESRLTSGQIVSDSGGEHSAAGDLASF